jgi:hypothetical protein
MRLAYNNHISFFLAFFVISTLIYEKLVIAIQFVTFFVLFITLDKVKFGYNEQLGAGKIHSL